MDFARKQMEKYGWKDGEGLGKDGNQGITVAIKPHYKTGKEGMGFDLSKELVDTWWTRSYSDSLSRIDVNSVEGDRVVVSTPCGDDGVDDDRPMAKMRKRMLKANFTDFTKGAILSNGELVEEEKNDSLSSNTIPEVTSRTTFQLTDEELLKACGGRTAHKAARFGMKLSGKLARIASQEENTALTSDFNKSPKERTNRRSKKRKENVIDSVDTNEVLSLELVVPDNDSSTDRKRKKKKKKRGEETPDVTQDYPVVENKIIKNKKSKKHKKKYLGLHE